MLFQKFFEIARIVALISVVVVLFGIVLKVTVGLFAMAITFIFATTLTVRTFNKWSTAVLSIGGIALYAASWPITSVWGVWPGTPFWAVGILLWLSAVCLSFDRRPSRTRRAQHIQSEQDEEPQRMFRIGFLNKRPPE